MENNNGVYTIENARLTNWNFEGRATKFKPAGDKTVTLVIDDEAFANQLISDGYNVKSNDEAVAERGVDRVWYLALKLKYRDFGIQPVVKKISGQKIQTLNVDTVGMLDGLPIKFCRLVFNPYDWTTHSGSGRSAYIKTLYVEVEIDEFEHLYANHKEVSFSEADDELGGEWAE